MSEQNTDKCVRVEVSDGVATLIWDMPGRAQNVFNRASITDFDAALDAVLADEAVTGIIVTSAKKDFIAGADLESVKQMALGPKDPVALNESVGALTNVLRKLEVGGKPVVAAINGTAMGGGLELALACHHRIATDESRVKLGLPEVSLGLLPGAGGTQRLPRMIGVKPSLPWLMEGKRFGTQESLAMGVVDAVVPAEGLLDAARAWLATGPAAERAWDKNRGRGFVVPGGGIEEKQTSQMLMVGTAMLMDKTHGNFPAPLAIMSCVAEGLRVSLDEGLQIEKRYFISLLLDPRSGAMVNTLFLSMQKVGKLAGRPAGVDKLVPTKIGVIGAGLMGAGIAYSTAKSGIDVVLLDLDQARADTGKAYSASRLAKSVKKGRRTQAQMDAVLARITPTADYADLDGCELIVEAVFENRDIKATVTRSIEAAVSGAAIVGSNTSTLPITGLAQASSRPANFIGLHFFSPVERMPLVEIITGEQTSAETLAKSMDYVQAIGKTPIVCKDSRGFYTSRVFGTYVTEGVSLLTEGVVPALIENAGKATGMPMPPLALADAVGLKLMYSVGLATKADLGDAAPDNPSQPVLEELVAKQDRHGKSNDKGFYDYEGRSKRLWSGLSELYPPAAAQPDVETVKRRLLYVQALEACRVYEQGLVATPAEVDVGAILGWGFAAWSGGPLSLIDQIGAAEFVARCEVLAAAHGERFAPTDGLRKMAASGARFYSI
ncbi:MAG: 3-hydroxyacyl-CoA dehydrogenase NAD-binding domain-containing protein [Myxococcota bacterium]|nr:3-hydroxyacyl-CoA dehydrogenase NAD-binding domain-containing protein [Myxococcota bacterium]